MIRAITSRCLAIAAVFAITMTVSAGAVAKAKHKAKHAVPAREAVEPASLKPEERALPLEAVPHAVVDALASGDLNGAIIAIRDEPQTPKLNYLLGETSRIVGAVAGKKPDSSGAHKYYQNMAIGYHNLFLFLKSQGITQEDYFKKAKKYYGKARSAATVLHKSECDILEASLFAAAGNKEEAAKLFSKVDEGVMRGDFESEEYLAAYHAAMDNDDDAIAALEAAYKINPERTLLWLSVGDDFYGISKNERFQSLYSSWRAKHKNKDLTLSVPKPEQPHLEIQGPEEQFAPQKMMAHPKKETIRQHGKKGHEKISSHGKDKKSKTKLASAKSGKGTKAGSSKSTKTGKKEKQSKPSKAGKKRTHHK